MPNGIFGGSHVVKRKLANTEEVNRHYVMYINHVGILCGIYNKGQAQTGSEDLQAQTGSEDLHSNDRIDEQH